MTSEAQALLQIEIAQEAARRAREALEAAEAQLSAAMRAYAKARPLTAVERETLAKRVARGAPLCCVEGRRWLREQLPQTWADVLNSWAYEALSCSEKRPERIAEYADRVRALKLDELPPGTSWEEWCTLCEEIRHDSP